MWFGALVFLAGCTTPVHRPTQPGNWSDVPPLTEPPSFVAPVVPAPPALTKEPSVSPPVLHTNAPVDLWVPLRRWAAETGAGTVRCVAPPPSPAFALVNTNGDFVFRVHTRVANWNGLDLQLGFAPQWTNGQIYVHSLDLRKNVDPLINPSLRPVASHRIIVLDPGHGGISAGTPSVLGRGHEKDYTLDWAFRLSELLAAQGWQVFLTRTNDCGISLSNRVAFAEAHRADLFLSLHFNSAAPDRTQAGLETYCLTPRGMPSNLLRTAEDDASLSFINNQFDAANLQLAAQLHRSLLRINGQHDRGVRHARFLGVLRGQNRPAVLIEGGYLSNPYEARRIADPAYRQLLAQAVAEALPAPGLESGPLKLLKEPISH
jgi:N-acetylmuramoyl-L-alanine amidase